MLSSVNFFTYTEITMKINKPIIMTAHVRTTDKGTSIEFSNNKPKMIIKVRPKLLNKK